MTEAQIRIVEALQDGIPLTVEPFREAAEKAGVSHEELLGQVQMWKDEGIIRRFGAMLHHHRAGYSVNAMGVWNVPDEGVEDFGRIAADCPAVSHCYQRPRFDDFRYNLYAMIHGKSREDCETAARKISMQTGITDYALLYTTVEFKKASPVYFASEHGPEGRDQPRNES